MAYIGQGPFNEFSTIPTKDTFTGDGSTTVFDMAVEVPSGSENALEVFVDNIRQEPGSGKAFTLGLDGSNVNKRITFTAAPANGAAIYVINDKTNTTTIVNPIDLGGVELILDADNDTSITADTDDQIDFKIGSADHLKILSSSGDTVLKPMVDAKDIIFQQFDGNKVFEINDGNFVSVGGNAAAPGEIRIYEDTDLGTNYSGFKVGNLTGSVAYQLPLADGNSGQALATNGSGVLSWATVAANTPTSADGQALGSASLEWSDLFLADAAVINFGADQDINITHVADTGLTTNGTFQATTITATTAFVPDASDGAALGTTALQFSDLFLADGAVINFGDDQDINLTHVADTGLTTNGDFSVGDDLTVLGGQFDLKTNSGSVAKIKFYCESGNAHAQTLQAQPHSASASDVLTLPTGGDSTLVSRLSTDTLTNKTLTSPVINTGTFGTSILPTSADGTTLGSASKEFSDLFLADSSTIQFGADQDVIITHVADTGILLSGTNVIQFNDASQNIGAPSNAILDINATDEIELNATLVDVNANLDVSGTITSGGVITGTAFTAGSAVLAEAELELLDGLTAGTAIASKVVTTDANIDSTGMRNLTISGEIDAATGDFSGAVDVAGATTVVALTASGIIKTDDATDATSTTDGSLQTDGGLSVAKDAVIGDDLKMLSDSAVIHFGADSDVTLTHVADKGLTLSTATGDDSLILQSTLADNNSAPRLKLHRASGSPADNDLLGAITWSFLDDGGNSHEAAYIRATATDVSNGSEDASLEFNVDVAGSDVNRMNFDATGVVFNEGSVDLDFRVESNDATHQLFVDGGNNKVYIGAGSGNSIDNMHLQLQNQGLTVSSFAGDANSNEIHFIKSRNTTVGSSTVVSNGDQLGSIVFQGDDGTDYATPGASIRAIVDGNAGGNDMPGALILSTTADGASSVTERIRIHSSGNVGIGTNNAQTTLHVEGTAPIIRISDSNSTSEADATGAIQFYDRNNTDINNSITSGDGSSNDFFITNHNSKSIIFSTNGAEAMRLTNGQQLGMREAAVDVDQGGICLNQGGDDGNILTFKSSDVAHARTSVAETDTYAEFKKAGANDGGLHLTTMNDAGNVSFYVDSHARSFDTGKGTGDHGCINLDANKHDGSNGGETITSNGNMVTISNDNSVRFIFDAEGDFHADSSSTTFDSYEDAQLVRAYDLSHGKGVIASKFDKFVQYNTGDLTDAGLVGRITSEYNKDGTKANPLINMSGFMRLHNGAIWQQYEKTQRLTQAMYKLAVKTLGKEEADKLLDEEEIKLLN